MMWHYCTNPRADTEGAGETSLSGDDVELCSTCASEKLAASYAFAQSTKLSVSERQVDAEIERTKHVPVTLARTGKIPLSASAISKQTGVLFILRSSVNLTSDILDTPEVFWDDDSFEPTYELATAYLDLSTRVDIVNTRLDILRELLDMLSSQLEVDHSVRLEWIVIWLIVAEVVLELASILWDHFDRHNEEF
ncbi:RMD1 [Symbiodinium sp. KB8]|nr:RMD1 [Symbiodinium sp. KB8]